MLLQASYRAAIFGNLPAIFSWLLLSSPCSSFVYAVCLSSCTFKVIVYSQILELILCNLSNSSPTTIITTLYLVCKSIVLKWTLISNIISISITCNFISIRVLYLPWFIWNQLLMSIHIVFSLFKIISTYPPKSICYLKSKIFNLPRPKNVNSPRKW